MTDVAARSVKHTGTSHFVNVYGACSATYQALTMYEKVLCFRSGSILYFCHTRPDSVETGYR